MSNLDESQEFHQKFVHAQYGLKCGLPQKSGELAALLGVIACEYPDKSYLSTKQNHCAT